MSRISRAGRLAALCAAYSLFECDVDACQYCGAPADTYDHVPPISYAFAVGAMTLADKGVRLLRVLSCRECNALLGDHPADTIAKRKAIIKKRLRVRYAKFLRCPHWSDHEIEELGPHLVEVVKAGVTIGEWVRRRIAW